MRYKIFEIPYQDTDPQYNNKFNFIVGTRVKPDNVLKEKIRAQIGEAMGAFGISPEGYSVMVIEEPGGEESPKENGISVFSDFPGFRIEINYILFVLLSGGGSGEFPPDKELEEIKAEIAGGIICPDKSQIALVLLYDASIEVLITEGYARLLW